MTKAEALRIIQALDDEQRRHIARHGWRAADTCSYCVSYDSLADALMYQLDTGGAKKAWARVIQWEDE